MAKNKRKRKPPRKRQRKTNENRTFKREPVERADPETRFRTLWHRLFGPTALTDNVAGTDRIREDSIHKKANVGSRLRALKHRLFRPNNEEDNVAATLRMIDETCAHTETTFRAALLEIEKAESARPRLSRKPPSMARVDAVIAKFDREIRELWASTCKDTADKPTTPATWRPDAARERLEELEEHLHRLAETRDSHADHAAEWERRAMMAVKAENDELAIEALQRKREHDQVHRLSAREHEYGLRVISLLRELLDAVVANSADDARSDRGKPTADE